MAWKPGNVYFVTFGPRLVIALVLSLVKYLILITHLVTFNLVHSVLVYKKRHRRPEIFDKFKKHTTLVLFFGLNFPIAKQKRTGCSISLVKILKLRNGYILLKKIMQYFLNFCQALPLNQIQFNWSYKLMCINKCNK